MRRAHVVSHRQTDDTYLMTEGGTSAHDTFCGLKYRVFDAVLHFIIFSGAIIHLRDLRDYWKTNIQIYDEYAILIIGRVGPILINTFP